MYLLAVGRQPLESAQLLEADVDRDGERRDVVEEDSVLLGDVTFRLVDQRVPRVGTDQLDLIERVKVAQ